MFTLSVNTSEVQAVVANLARAGERATAAAQAVIDRYAALIAREAKGLAPFDTGALRASIRAELSRLAAVVLSDLPYSSAVELGVRSRPAYPAQPFLGPALETHRSGFTRDLIAAVRTALGAR